MTAIRIIRNDGLYVTYPVRRLKIRKKDRPKCGARTRTGTQCQSPSVWDKANNKPRNGRCKLHGGLSTGARTAKGREAIRESNRRRTAVQKDFFLESNI